MSHYQTFQEFNQTGLAGLFKYPAEIVPLFVPLLLFSLFMIAFLGTFFSGARVAGRGGDFFASFAVASFFIAIMSMLMTLMDGFINTATVVICIGISVASALLLLVTKARD